MKAPEAATYSLANDRSFWSLGSKTLLLSNITEDDGSCLGQPPSEVRSKSEESEAWMVLGALGSHLCVRKYDKLGCIKTNEALTIPCIVTELLNGHAAVRRAIFVLRHDLSVWSSTVRDMPLQVSSSGLFAVKKSVRCQDVFKNLGWESSR